MSERVQVSERARRPALIHARSFVRSSVRSFVRSFVRSSVRSPGTLSVDLQRRIVFEACALAQRGNRKIWALGLVPGVYVKHEEHTAKPESHAALVSFVLTLYANAFVRVPLSLTPHPAPAPTYKTQSPSTTR